IFGDQNERQPHPRLSRSSEGISSRTCHRGKRSASHPNDPSLPTSVATSAPVAAPDSFPAGAPQLGNDRWQRRLSSPHSSVAFVLSGADIRATSSKYCAHARLTTARFGPVTRCPT